ncbi:MAG TPA: hypothetical protein VM925_28910 [Labilithrix sp.]|jgi:hypothetical protein|nr:hypothetical protein [Labilithrix sp.]
MGANFGYVLLDEALDAQATFDVVQQVALESGSVTVDAAYCPATDLSSFFEEEPRCGECAGRNGDAGNA